MPGIRKLGRTMKRLLRWIGAVLGSVAGLAIGAYVVAYVLSERVLRHTYEVPAVAISIPTDPASISEGRPAGHHSRMRWWLPRQASPRSGYV